MFIFMGYEIKTNTYAIFYLAIATDIIQRFTFRV